MGNRSAGMFFNFPERKAPNPIPKTVAEIIRVAE